MRRWGVAGAREDGSASGRGELVEAESVSVSGEADGGGTAGSESELCVWAVCAACAAFAAVTAAWMVVNERRIVIGRPSLLVVLDSCG